MAKTCYFKCLKNTHEPILLQNNVQTIIGRNKDTRIKDQGCSRQQLSLTPNYADFSVNLKQVGANPCGLEGFATVKDLSYSVGHGTRIDVLVGKYPHLIEFEPPPKKPKISSPKRKISTESADATKKKCDDHVDESPASKSFWENYANGELYIYSPDGLKPCAKIAAFDMDGTLIKTKSGKVHPVDNQDWVIAFSTVTQKLKELAQEDYKIVIFSNQAAIGNGRVKFDDFKVKIENIVDYINVPIQVFLSTGKGHYRKPCIGMWEVLVNKKNGNSKINMTDSFYCGDAAGRPAGWLPGRKKDHSMVDKLMADNVGLKFYIPEQFFVGQSLSKIVFSKPEFDPKQLRNEEFNPKLISDKQEMLVLVGYPGSGKSFIAKQIESKSDRKYVTVCRDKLGTWQKCASEATKFIEQGMSVIVDSTNPDIESRSRWVTLAKKLKVGCRCAWMKTSLAHARHNNKFRELMKTSHMPVSDVVFYSYRNKFIEPKMSEGFSEILQVNFNPCFENEHAEKLYRMYLLEK